MTSPFILGMIAETPLHPGTGQSTGVVDLPVSRERPTGYPQIPETGFKGGLKQWVRERYPDTDGDFHEIVKRLFGMPELEEQDGIPVGGAGELLVSTGRLLLLPVRRLDGPYAWVTTPGLVERLGRDMERVLKSSTCPTITQPGECKLRCGFHAGGRTEFLEEFPFTTAPLDGDADTRLVSLLQELVGPGTGPANRLGNQIAIMDDDDFDWYLENALPVNARNELDDAKISRNLWYEETLPVDSVFYVALPPRAVLKDGFAERYSALEKMLGANPYLQIGGNETVGHGWVHVTTYFG